MTQSQQRENGGGSESRISQPYSTLEEAMPRPTRRAFLIWLTRGVLAAAAGLAAGQIARFFSFEPVAPAPTVIPVDKPADYPANALTYAEAARAYVGHDSQGLYAIDAVCTHLGCLVEHETDDGFACPCHGSHFAAEGQVQNGPANQALHHLHLALNPDGQVVVDRSRQVTPDARLTLTSESGARHFESAWHLNENRRA